MTLPTRRQGFARIVFDCVKSIKDAADKEEKRKAFVAAYAGYAVELPSLIRNNGLAQTVAFLEHKGRSGDGDSARATGARDLCKDFNKVLGDVFHYPANYEPGALSTSTFDYLVATRRALEASEYFKRFAESVLGADRGQRGAQT